MVRTADGSRRAADAGDEQCLSSEYNLLCSVVLTVYILLTKTTAADCRIAVLFAIIYEILSSDFVTRSASKLRKLQLLSVVALLRLHSCWRHVSAR